MRRAAVAAGVAYFICSLFILVLAFINYKVSLLALINTEKSILSVLSNPGVPAKSPTSPAPPTAVLPAGPMVPAAAPAISPSPSTSTAISAGQPLDWNGFLEFRDKVLDNNSLTFLLTLSSIMFASVGLAIYVAVQDRSRETHEKVKKYDQDRTDDSVRAAFASSLLAQFLDLACEARFSLYGNITPSDSLPVLRDRARKLAASTHELRENGILIPHYQDLQLQDLQLDLDKYTDALSAKDPKSAAIKDTVQHLKQAKVDLEAMRPRNQR